MEEAEAKEDGPAPDIHLLRELHEGG
jgi:hypothetical protein